MRRLAIVASHPVQYQVPWFRALAAEPGLEVEVLFGHYASGREQAAAGFGVEFDWDTPLLEGYPHRFLRNAAKEPSVNTFAGVDTPEIGDVLRTGRYDAVLVSGWHTRSYLQAMRACWREGRPVMVRSDSNLRNPRPWWLRLAKDLPWRYFIWRMDACLAAGTWSKDYFLYYGADPKRIFVVPHSTPVDPRCADVVSLRQAARQRWGIPDDAFVALFAGKFIDVKRPLDFIRAVAASEGTVFGLLAGDGPLRRTAENLATALAASVHFAGFLNQGEMGQAYAAADVLVLPSERETWGLVVNEAMAWGLPCIVSSEVGCGPDLVDPGITGYVFPLDDVAGLAALLRSAAADRLTVSELGRNARRRIAGYTPHAAARATLDAVNGVLEQF